MLNKVKNQSIDSMLNHAEIRFCIPHRLRSDSDRVCIDDEATDRRLPSTITLNLSPQLRNIYVPFNQKKKMKCFIVVAWNLISCDKNCRSYGNLSFDHIENWVRFRKFEDMLSIGYVFSAVVKCGFISVFSPLILENIFFRHGNDHLTL